MAKVCPICESRKPKRLCPGLGTSRWAGKGESICPHCCGTEREVSIDCPSTCQYLIAARRYEAEHPEVRARAAAAEAKPSAELAFPDVRLDEDFIAEQQPLIGQIAFTIVRFAERMTKLADPEALSALEGLARTYQTLSSGLYYEQGPEGVRARELYVALQAALEAYQREQQKRAGVSLRPADIQKAVVFLLRVGQARSNGRPLSHAFLDFLRTQLPTEAAKDSAPRIILPGA